MVIADATSEAPFLHMLYHLTQHAKRLVLSTVSLRFSDVKDSAKKAGSQTGACAPCSKKQYAQ